MTEVYEFDATGIGLRRYLEVLWRRKLTVAVIVVISLVAAGVFTLQQQNQYKAQTTIVIGQAGGLVQPQNAGAIQPFSATMQELIRSTVVAQRVIQALGLNTTPSSLLGQISVSFNPESAALKVSVIDRSPEQAKAIAHQIGTSFSALVEDRFGKAEVKGPSTPPLSATVWDPAHVIPGKVQPRPKLNLFIAGILGLALGLLAAFLRDYFDRRLRTMEEIEHAFGVPVIGQIPSVGNTSRTLPRMLWGENGYYAEAFRALRANLQYLGVGRPLRKVLVTSVSADQGKTTVCANLAASLAQSGSSVALLEADLRRPQLGEVFGVPAGSSGLTTVLVGKAKLSRALLQIPLPLGSNAGNSSQKVAFLPSGPLPPNPSELVGSRRMQQTVEELAQGYDSVIVDSPPMLLVADALELAKLADGVIIVVRLQHATRDDARELRSLAARLGIQLVGVVVTDGPGRLSHRYRRYRAHGEVHEVGGPPAATTDVRPPSTAQPTVRANSRAKRTEAGNARRASR
jgi:succinoglycan biosynthesis transport protein ExoP